MFRRAHTEVPALAGSEEPNDGTPDSDRATVFQGLASMSLFLLARRAETAAYVVLLFP